MLTPERLSAARALFPSTGSGRIYLNHASTSPLSARVVAAIQTHLAERSTGSLETYPQDLEVVKRLKGNLARLIGAEGPGRIALQPNTSDALNVVAAGLPWKPGDEILLNDLEFPANVYPYVNLRTRGVELKILKSHDGEVTPDMVERATTPRTRLLALSAVQFLSGHRADLAAFGGWCRSRNIVFAVDGIQGVGAVRIDVTQMKIDALAAGGQKWQTAPHGTGFLYLSEELQSRIRQQYLGWLAVADPWNFRDYDQPLAGSARRYEGGSLNFLGIAGYDAAVAMLLEFGIDTIENHLLDITTTLMSGLRALPSVRILTPESRDARAGIVTVRLPAGTDEKEFLLKMEQRGITPAQREGTIRFSPHFYNSPGEMEQTVDCVRQLLHR